MLYVTHTVKELITCRSIVFPLLCPLCSIRDGFVLSIQEKVRQLKTSRLRRSTALQRGCLTALQMLQQSASDSYWTVCQQSSSSSSNLQCWTLTANSLRWTLFHRLLWLLLMGLLSSPHSRMSWSSGAAKVEESLNVTTGRNHYSWCLCLSH